MYDSSTTYSPDQLTAIAADLTKAAVYIETHGWVQHVSRTESGTACIQGALCLMLDGPAHPDDSLGLREARAQDFLRDEILGGISAIHWNDQKGRTAIEVIDALYRGAKLAEEMAKKGV